jgi:hypothetical protein
MRRLFWLGAGAAVGILVVAQMRKAARAVTPAGLADRAGASADIAAQRAGSFWSEVKTGMKERETELRTALGIDADSATDDDNRDDDDTDEREHPRAVPRLLHRPRARTRPEREHGR